MVEADKIINEAPKALAPVVPIIDGRMDFNNHLELRNTAVVMIKIKMAPLQLRDEGMEAVMAALLSCKQHNLTQDMMKYMYYIDGNLSWMGKLVTSEARKHPQYGERQDFFCDREYNQISFANKNLHAEVYGAIVRVRPKDSTVWSEYYFTVDDAKRANLIRDTLKPGSGWVKYCRDMLFHKANARALYAHYADSISGVSYYEDMVKEWKEPKDVTPTAGTAADEMGAAYSQVEA